MPLFHERERLLARILHCTFGARPGALVETGSIAVSVSGGHDLTACVPLLQAAARARPPRPSGLIMDHGGFRPPTSPNPIRVASKPVPFSMTGELETQYRALVVAHPEVKVLLGGRFAYVKVDPIPRPKGVAPTAIEVRMTYFSHTHNRAVTVLVKDGAIQNSSYSGDWPTEGKEEVEAAVALARSHPNLQGRLGDLRGGAMMAQALRGQAPWLGNRVLDVRFFDGGGTSRYLALVDLTTSRVLNAGPVQ